MASQEPTSSASYILGSENTTAPVTMSQSPVSKTWSYFSSLVRPTSFAELELVLLTFCIGIQGMTECTP